MALNNVGDIQTEILVRSNRTTTDSFITDTMLQDWLRDAYEWVADSHRWAVTERRDNTSAFTGTEENTYPTDFKSDGIRLLQIGGKRVEKIEFEDYQEFREDYPDRTDRVFSEFGRTYFINPNIDLSGTITAWSQYSPSIDPTDLTATTVFSGAQESLNDALVDKAVSYLKEREHLQDEANFYEQRARVKVEEQWRRLVDEQHEYKPYKNSEGIWRRVNFVDGTYYEDELNSDQF